MPGSQRTFTGIGSPLDCSGSGRGEADAPAALRRAGLFDLLGAEDAGDVHGADHRPDARPVRPGDCVVIGNRFDAEGEAADERELAPALIQQISGGQLRRGDLGRPRRARPRRARAARSMPAKDPGGRRATRLAELVAGALRG